MAFSKRLSLFFPLLSHGPLSRYGSFNYTVEETCLINKFPLPFPFLLFPFLRNPFSQALKLHANLFSCDRPAPQSSPRHLNSSLFFKFQSSPFFFLLSFFQTCAFFFFDSIPHTPHSVLHYTLSAFPSPHVHSH